MSPCNPPACHKSNPAVPARRVPGRLALLENGRPVTLRTLVGGRIDLRFGQDEAGEIYLLTKQDGKIRKLVAA